MVNFYRASEDQSIDKYKYIGGINLLFNPVMKYRFRRCNGTYSTFPVEIPTTNNRVWIITLSRTSAGRGIVIHCNGVKVLNVVLSNSTCNVTTWSENWSHDVAKFTFPNKEDTALQFYRWEPGKGLVRVTAFIFSY